MDSTNNNYQIGDVLTIISTGELCTVSRITLFGNSINNSANNNIVIQLQNGQKKIISTNEVQR
jgi:hypothetical protein